MGENGEFKQLALLEKLKEYSVHGTEKKQLEEKSSESQQLIESKPSLRYITQVANILRAPVEIQSEETENKKLFAGLNYQIMFPNSRVLWIYQKKLEMWFGILSVRKFPN